MIFPQYYLKSISMVDSYGFPSRYSDFCPLGSGGIGTVFKVADSRLNKELALKILKNPDPALRASIENEFSILTELQHPNLINVYDFGQSDSGYSYFTMDFIDGPNLYEYFQTPDSIFNSREILSGILEALDYLARKSILHGDIKPGNILISNKNRAHPVLLDFGLSTIAAFDHDKLFGTPRFLAPEIFSSRQYSLKSDLYALGHSFIESQLHNETPLANNITDEYLSAAQESLSQLYQDSGIEYPRNLASYIIWLSNPSLALRPSTPSQAIHKLSAISTLSSEDISILRAEYVVRKEIDGIVDQFIDEKDYLDRTLLLKGPIGSGKKSTMARAISKAQLQNIRVLSFIGVQTEKLSLQNILDTLSINLSSASSNKLFEQHQTLLNKIKKAEEAQDLDNIGVIYSNIVKFIHHLSKERPVLIALSNVDSARLDTIRFFAHLINEINYLKADIKVILSQSTDVIHDAEHDNHLTSLADNVKILLVRGFNAKETNVLCHKLFNSVIFTDAEIDSFLSFTDGIPLYILDYFNYLLLNDVITTSGRKYYVDHKILTKTYSITKYSSIVDNIVGSMTPNKLHLLQLLSIYKQPVDITLLEKAVLYDLIEIAQEFHNTGLAELHDNKLQLRSPIFKYHLSQNIVPGQLMILNHTLANYTLLSDPENHAVIAEHFIKAHAPEEAYEYAIKAHDNHLSRHEYYSAYSVLSSLNKISDDINNNEMRTIVLEKLASVEFTLGYSGDSLNHYFKLIDLVSDEVAISSYYIKIGRIERYYNGNIDKSVEYSKRALQIAHRNSAIEIESEALMYLGMALRDISFLEKAASITKDVILTKYVIALNHIMFLSVFSGLTDKCMSIEKELDKFLSTDDPAILSEIYDAKYIHAFFTGNYPVADKMLRKLIDLTEQSFNEIERSKLIAKLGGNYYIQGQFNQQIDTLNDAYHLVSKYQASMNKVNILSNLALAHFALANYSSAFSLIEEIKSSIDKNHMSSLPTYYYSVGAETFMIFGELYRDKYHEYSELLKNIALESNNKISLGHMNLRYGDYNYYSMGFKDCKKHYSKALDLFKGANAKDDTLEALLKLSLAHRHMNDDEKARDYAKQAAKIFREINCGYLKPLYSYVIALSECHDNPESLAPMLEAIDVSREFGTREWTWQIQFELARLYKQAGDISNSVKYCRESLNTLKEITESFDDSEQISSYLQVPLRAQVFDFVKSLKP